jgi:hypothetical protein
MNRKLFRAIAIPAILAAKKLQPGCFQTATGQQAYEKQSAA